MTALLSLETTGPATLSQRQAVAWAGRSIGFWRVRAIAGGTFGAGLKIKDAISGLEPGWLAGLSAGRTVLAQAGVRPYISGSAALAVASAQGERGARLTAADLRVGADVGWLLAGWLDIHAVARVFGGPVFWRAPGLSDTGTDRRHFQLGVGAGVLLGGAASLFAEAVPLGDVGGSVGLAVRL